MDLYNSLSQGPGGEAIRTILGGDYGTKQNLKSKRTITHSKALKNPKPIFIPDSDFFEDSTGDKQLVPQKLVEKTLKRNFPSSYEDDDQSDKAVSEYKTKVGYNTSRSRLNAHQGGTGIAVKWRVSGANVALYPLSSIIRIKGR